jgi:hypothetical protein
VDRRTLFRSQGYIQELFLSGTDFSEKGMNSTQSPDNISAAFPTCLLSFASDDRTFAEQLLNDLSVTFFAQFECAPLSSII